MNLTLSFSWVGLVIFALPMPVNIAYVLFPPAEKTEQAAVTHWVEAVEQISRVAYLLAVTLLVSREALDLYSVWLYLAAGFLALYHLVWLRYFAGGRKTELLRRAFLFVPLPLEVFPVLYFLCAAVWLHNPPAAIMMAVFGAAHITVSLQSFRKG